MKQKMSYSQVASNISKYDTFVSARLQHLQKKSSSKECLRSSNDSNFENEQKEVRKTPAKKISFKIKKNPSFCRRRNVDVQKSNFANSTTVAQLTQKFNNMNIDKDELVKPLMKPHISKRQDTGLKYNTLPARPSIKTNLMDKTLTTRVNVLKTNENNLRNQRNFTSNTLERSTNKRNCECLQRTQILTDKVRTDDCDEIDQNNKNNVVQAAINIFERRTSLCDNRNSIQAINSNIKLNLRRGQNTTVSNNFKRIIENNVHNNNNNINSDIFKEIYTLKKNEAKEEIQRVLLNDVPQLQDKFAKEVIAHNDRSFEFKSDISSSADTPDFCNVDLPITPNTSFLWREKSNANNKNYAYYPLVKLRPKSDSALNTIETGNHSHSRPQIFDDMQDCTEGIYEKINIPWSDENIYEIMSPVEFKQGERTSIRSANSSINVSETENSISNCYESIYSRDYKTNVDGECIYESVYERMLSCSNRDSLVSCEQNSNSLYGKTLWESEDESSIYKPVSDLSDDWVDITDNEDSHNVKSGIIIKCEKQRNRKSTWSQHLREQWAKTYSPVSVTVDLESDPDHHYETLHSKKEQDDDYDSFESDSCSEHSFKSDEEYYIQNVLPKPPNSQAHGIIKFAGKHMKKLKRRSIDLSKSLSRMTKRISRTDANMLNADKNGSRQSIEPKTNEYITRESLKNQLSSKSHVAKNSVIYENVDPAIDTPQKLGGEQEKERLSLLKRIRRSMSMSTESALELTSNLSNKPRSTFYLTEVIDIDKSDNDVTSPKDAITVSKTNITRPRSPPPEIPVKNKETNKTSITENIYEENENKSRTCWYTEFELYKGPDTTPSTSTAENSGSGISNLDINQDSEDYYNMMNRRYSKGDTININESDEEKCSLDDTLNCTTPDIQLLLQDEPLYQFYDAAVLESIYQDGTYHFETDNYEDVDNYSELSSNSESSPEHLVLPKKTTIPFTKTFWCEVPEVIQSSVLSKLSIRQKKLQEAKFEIITSEASYVNSLNVLNDHFALNLKECDFINEKEWQIMFGKVASVKACSQKLLQELEKCWQENILLYGICDVIQKQAEDNFNVFIPYCENQMLLGDTLSQLMERPGFANYLKQLESNSSCQSLTFYSFLMLPMQRITRWPLLVDAVLKRLSQSDPEYVVCQYTLATLNKIVSQCNEAARKKEREIELQTISNKLEFPKGVTPINIISQDRWLVRSGNVMSIQQKSDDSKMTFGKRFNKIQLCLYLFNDMCLVTKEKSNEVYTILHYCPRNLVELRDADMLLPKRDGYEKNLLFLTVLENQDGKTIEFVLSCNKESDKERWMEAISPPKSEDPEETLYECWDCPQVIASHNYTSLQPDELSLSRGDTINVLRKMGDGWYHGERIRDGQTGWFPANYTSEIMNPHVRARNLKQRYRLLAFSENYLKTS